MATITRRKAGYQAQVRRTGYPTRSKCFTALRDAEMWARQVENELDRGLYLWASPAFPDTFGKLMNLLEVSDAEKAIYSGVQG